MAIAGTLTYKTDLDTRGVKKSGSTVKSIIAGLGITKMISKAMSTISSSLDGAISRYDTLNNFPKVMSNLGISAKESEKAIKKMSDKLAGLPTTLDQGALAVQRFTSKNGDVAKSTDLFLALNNALLAGGASTEIQATALEQLSQAYAKGKPDMMEWRSVQTAMPAQLNQISKEMLGNKNNLDKFLKKAKEFSKANPLSSTASELVEQLENVKKGTGDMTTALGTGLRTGVISMDQFMNTIVKLNQKGTKNFKSFETQARNSTAGLNTAIVVAKTQVVKGLTDILTSIDKSLKKSGTSMSKIISDLGKNAKKVLDNIAKALEKVDFVAIFNALKKLLPVIVSVTTAWIAYNVAIKATALIGIVSSITSTASAFIKLIPSIKSAKDAMTLLNMTLNVNPIVAVTTAVVALTTALALLSNSKKSSDSLFTQQQKQYEEEKKALEEQTQSINQNIDSWKDLQTQKQKNIDAGMTELSHYENLTSELGRIVDKNGKVKKGYEERAKFITSQLSDALGVEIKMTNGVIKNYASIQKEIKKVIEQKKAKIILDANEEEYTEAIKNQTQETKKLKEIETQRNEESAKRKDLLDKLEQAEEEARKNSGKWSASLRAEKDATIEYYKNLIKQSDDRLNTLKSNYSKQEDLVKQYAYGTMQYEKNLELFHKGQYDKMTTVNWNYVKEYEKTEDAKKAQLKDEISTTETHLKILKEMKNEYQTNEYDDQIKADEKLLKQQKSDLKKYQEQQEIGLGDIEDDWKKYYKQLIIDSAGKQIEFKKVGKDQIQMYVNGVKEGKPKSTKEMQTLVKEAIDKIKSGKTDAKTAGENLIDGVRTGVSNPNKQNQVYSSIANFGTNLLTKFKAALQEHSPSKATREMGGFLLEGVSLGIKDEEKNTLKDVNNFGNNVLEELSSSMDMSKQLEDMYKEMNKTIQMENAKLNFDVMSNNAYNRTMQLPAIIDLSANFEGTVPVQLNLDGEKIYDNQQKISVRKSIQYGGVK